MMRLDAWLQTWLILHSRMVYKQSELGERFFKCCSELASLENSLIQAL